MSDAANNNPKPPDSHNRSSWTPYAGGRARGMLRGPRSEKGRGHLLIPGSGSGAREGTLIAHQAVNTASFQPMNRTYVVSVEDLETLISEARHLALEEDASDRLPVVVDEGVAQGSPHLGASSIYDLGERSPRPALHRSGARTDQAEAALTDICEGVGRPIADRPRTEARNGSQCSTDTVQSFGRRRRGWIARPECGRRDPSCQ